MTNHLFAWAEMFLKRCLVIPTIFSPASLNFHQKTRAIRQSSDTSIPDLYVGRVLLSRIAWNFFLFTSQNCSKFYLQSLIFVHTTLHSSNPNKYVRCANVIFMCVSRQSAGIRCVIYLFTSKLSTGVPQYCESYVR